ncbi:prepilin peptidase CpaA [Azospirillaceae bacterium]
MTPLLALETMAELLLIMAAVHDLRRFLISNKICLALAILFIPYALLAWPATTSGWHILTGLAVLVGGVGLFAAGWIGGGDVKLLAAATLWLGPEHLSELLLLTASVGGIVALATLAATRNPRAPIPYGVAISAAALLCLMSS